MARVDDESLGGFPLHDLLIVDILLRSLSRLFHSEQHSLMTVLRYYCPGDDTIVLLRKKTATTPMLQPKEKKKYKRTHLAFYRIGLCEESRY